ncbi:hypothetical protein C8R44DRAFT_728837 [Mycena epipterygia]|nr:hypothetical protein C8R44DRAFT_728837 [Mycena epipterygia]
MAPKKKLPVDQQEFIELWMPEYLLKRAAGKSDEFWIKMKTAFFIEWPEEVCLNLPVQQVDLDVNAEPPRRLTADEKVLLDEAIAARIGQLKNSFRNAYAKIRNQKGGVGKSVLSLAALLFKSRPKARRRHQVLELYHKLFKSKVHAALQQTEYERLNEAAECRDDDGVWVDDDDDEVKMRRVTNTRSQRMKVMRRVVQELWDAESEVLRQEVREAAAKEVVVPEKVVVSEGEEGANVERTPEEYQMSIDESLQVAQMFLGEFQRMTGWMGALAYGGPVPQHKGAFGVKCLPEGLTFDRWHPNWKKKVTDPLVRFLRQAIPREVRLRRAIFTGEDDEGDEDDDNLHHRVVTAPAPVEDSEAPAVTKKAKKKKKKAAPRKQASTADVVVLEPQPEFTQGEPTFDGAQFEGQGYFTPHDNLGLEAQVLTSQPDYASEESQVQDTVAWTNWADGFVFPPVEQLMQTRENSVISDFTFPPAEELVQTRENSVASDFNQDTDLFASQQPVYADMIGTHFSSQQPTYTHMEQASPLHMQPDQTLGLASSSYFGVFGDASSGPSAAILGSGPGSGSWTARPSSPPSTPRPSPRPRAAVKDKTSPANSVTFGRPGQYRLRPTGSSSSISTTRTTNSPPMTPVAPPTTPSLAPMPARASLDIAATPGPAATSVLVVTAAPAVTPVWTSPLAHQLSTPWRLSSVPARSSPLTRPPLQADSPPRAVTPPPVESLPPRMRPSPVRNASATTQMGGARSPSVYPRSRPMANEPKAPKLTAAERGIKLAAARAAKIKPAWKRSKASNVEQEQRLGTEGERAAVNKAKGKEKGRAKDPAGEAESAGQLLTYSSTDNNRTRLKAMKLAEEKDKEDAQARKAANLRIFNPDGPSELFITSGRPRRTIYEPTNRGVVLSLKQCSDALVAKAQAEDDALIKALATGKKRGAATQENRAPAKRGVLLDTPSINTDLDTGLRTSKARGPTGIVYVEVNFHLV